MGGVEQPRFTDSPSKKALEKQTKSIDDWGKGHQMTFEVLGKELTKSSGEKDPWTFLKQN